MVFVFVLFLPLFLFLLFNNKWRNTRFSHLKFSFKARTFHYISVVKISLLTKSYFLDSISCILGYLMLSHMSKQNCDSAHLKKSLSSAFSTWTISIYLPAINFTDHFVFLPHAIKPAKWTFHLRYYNIPF